MIGWEFLLGTVLTWILVLQLALIIWNSRQMVRPPAREWSDDAPLISVLIPARNEASVIGDCLSHVLAQDYPNLQVVVLDDNSIDATAAIVRSFGDRRIRLSRGEPLPAGWTGKNWACHQLARKARGRIMCFVDADTLLEPTAVAAAAGALEDSGAGLVSLLPRSNATSISARVLLPMVSHALLGLFPVKLIHSPRHPDVAVAFGPFLMVTQTAYAEAGGHAANPEHIVDDVQLSRGVKRAGHPIRLLNGTDLVQTRWYEHFGEIWKGFSKNAYGALDYNPWFGSAVVFLVMPLLLTPFVRIGFGLIGDEIPSVTLWQVLLLLASRSLTSWLGRDRQWTTPFHALTVAFWGTALARSMLLSATGESVAWKDRDVPTRPT